MASAFFQTVRSLRADSFRVLWWSVPALVVFLSAWVYWFCFGSVGLYEVSEAARVEVVRTVSPVQTSVPGSVVVNHLAVGREVAATDVLIELDVSARRIELNEQLEKVAATKNRRAALTAEIRARESAATEAALAAGLAIEEARARLEEAMSAARFSDKQAEHVSGLRKDNAASEIEATLALAEAEQRTAAADAARIAIDRLQREQNSATSLRHAELRKLERQLIEVDIETTTIRAGIERLEHEIERRTIRAPVAGTIGEVLPLTAGAVIERGTRIASIIPAGEVKVVATFTPSKAVGRIKSAQRGRIRFEGFPWGQYGTVPARVTGVAREVRNGVVQVELALSPDANPSIPIQHGLPCSVEVEVERVSPVSLVLRTAGGRVARSRSQERASGAGESRR